MPSSSSPSPKSYCLQWLSLIGIIWLQAINGTNTNFPSYSSQLKTTLSLSQLQLNNLAFASDAGKLFGWLSGLAASHLPLWLVLSAGSALGLLGYGLQYLSLITAHPLPYSYFFLLTLLAGNSICWINTVSYLVTIRNFPPRHRQLAVGLSTSYQGLSAKIYADVFAASVGATVNAAKRAEAYLFLNSVAPVAVGAVTAPFVGGIGAGMVGEGRGMEAGFIAMFGITVATGVYSVVSSLGRKNSGPLSNLIGTLVFMFVPFVIPVADKIRVALERWDLSGENRVYNFTVDENNNNNNDNNNNVGGVKLEEGNTGDGVGEDNYGVVREEIGVRKMVRRVDFWLYFFVYFSSVTLGSVFLNNLGQIAESRGCSNTSSLVSLSSSFGFFGRLVPSLLDYHFLR